MRGRGLKRGMCRDWIQYSESPPMRGRGLKRVSMFSGTGAFSVAPYAGAWIETYTPRLAIVYPVSPPMRGRGLKHAKFIPQLISHLSPPMRGRGLKLVTYKDHWGKLSRPPCGGVD